MNPPNVEKWYLEDDLLGVFSRINFFATYPTFKRAREVEEAAHLLALAPFGLETSLSEHLVQVAEVYRGKPARNVSALAK